MRIHYSISKIIKFGLYLTKGSMKMGEKSEFAAKGSIAALQEKAMDIIASRPEGIYQSDLRRLLEIDSSKCSKVVARLQGSELIRRESVPASSTYLLKLSGAVVPSPADGSSNADGRIKKLIDRQIDRLIDRRVFGQVNRRIQCSIGKIEDTINRKTDSSMDGKRSSPIESENDGPRDFNELDRPVGSYFDCSIEDNLGSKSEEDMDIDDRVDSYFNHNRLPGSRSHIDIYLTEFYLLYLTRATSF